MKFVMIRVDPIGVVIATKCRLRAVPLRSVTSKLGRTGESEFTRARKARVRSERKPRGSWGEGGKGGKWLKKLVPAFFTLAPVNTSKLL